MVVGVRKSLEEGRTYSYADLSDRFGLRGAEFERILDYLVERGCLKPQVFERRHQDGKELLHCVSREHHLRWEA
ncbi:hypothetical protein [Raoultibacter massiliensis]|uniref:hypothetical protein n=1 Tax=Raoultibacter massiliensis TaxID=1852371 RepID=UPI000C81B85A|nr:hypothetical protein [Raoultibacter massiliensis]